MDWEMIGALGESLGAVAVVVSLIYLARQVRSATREAHDQRRSHAVTSMNEVLALVAGNSEVAEIYVRGLEGLDGLARVEEVRFSSVLTHLFSAFEEGFQAQRAGDWPDWSAQDVTATLAYVSSYPGVRAWWAGRRTLFSAEYTEHVDHVIDQTRPTLPARTATEPVDDAGPGAPDREGKRAL